MSIQEYHMRGVKIVSLHIVVGALIFYFLIHPISMVIYWIDSKQPTINLEVVFAAFNRQVSASFSPEMTGMAVSFTILGALVGLGSGIYYWKGQLKVTRLTKQEQQLNSDIKMIIRNGESDLVEFKSSLRYDYFKNDINLALELVTIKTIAGFMNAAGGKLLIGVSDAGDIVGLANDYRSLKKKNKDGFELKLIQLVGNLIGKELCHLIRVFFYEFDGQEICAIDVSKSGIPVYVTEK